MTQGSGKRRSAGKRLFGILIAAIVLVSAAQGDLWAQMATVAPQEKSQETDQKRKERVKVRRSRGGRQVTRPVAGQTVSIDSATGKLRQPTAEEAQILAAGLQQMLSQSAEGLVVVQHPDGTLSVDLQDRFQDVAVATINADGSVSLGCVSDPKGAEAFLKGRGAGSAGDPAANQPQHPATSAAEKE